MENFGTQLRSRPPTLNVLQRILSYQQVFDNCICLCVANFAAPTAWSEIRRSFLTKGLLRRNYFILNTKGLLYAYEKTLNNKSKEERSKCLYEYESFLLNALESVIRDVRGISTTFINLHKYSYTPPYTLTKTTRGFATNTNIIRLHQLITQLFTSNADSITTCGFLERKKSFLFGSNYSTGALLLGETNNNKSYVEAYVFGIRDIVCWLRMLPELQTWYTTIQQWIDVQEHATTDDQAQRQSFLRSVSHISFGDFRLAYRDLENCCSSTNARQLPPLPQVQCITFENIDGNTFEPLLERNLFMPRFFPNAHFTARRLHWLFIDKYIVDRENNTTYRRFLETLIDNNCKLNTGYFGGCFSATTAVTLALQGNVFERICFGASCIRSAMIDPVVAYYSKKQEQLLLYNNNKVTSTTLPPVSFNVTIEWPYGCEAIHWPTKFRPRHGVPPPLSGNHDERVLRRTMDSLLYREARELQQLQNVVNLKFRWEMDIYTLYSLCSYAHARVRKDSIILRHYLNYVGEKRYYVEDYDGSGRHSRLQQLATIFQVNETKTGNETVADYASVYCSDRRRRQRRMFQGRLHKSYSSRREMV